MIQSLLRAMELLELLKEANHKYSIAELSESTGLPPSTIHRILQTFCEKKYVIRDEHAHTYQLGPALISLVGRRLTMCGFRMRRFRFSRTSPTVPVRIPI